MKHKSIKYQDKIPVEEPKITCLVVFLVMAGEDADIAREDTAQWQDSLPTARFMNMGLPDLDFMAASCVVRDKLIAAAANLGLDPDCTILVGFGSAGRFAIDVLLASRVPCAGGLGLNIALAHPLGRITPTQAMVRLVQPQPTDPVEFGHFNDLLSKIQRQGIDLRSLLLMDEEEKNTKALLRAGGAYLAELVAITSSDRRRGS